MWRIAETQAGAAATNLAGPRIHGRAGCEVSGGRPAVGSQLRGVRCYAAPESLPSSMRPSPVPRERASLSEGESVRSSWHFPQSWHPRPSRRGPFSCLSSSHRAGLLWNHHRAWAFLSEAGLARSSRHRLQFQYSHSPRRVPSSCPVSSCCAWKHLPEAERMCSSRWHQLHQSPSSPSSSSCPASSRCASSLSGSPAL